MAVLMWHLPFPSSGEQEVVERLPDFSVLWPFSIPMLSFTGSLMPFKGKRDSALLSVVSIITFFSITFFLLLLPSTVRDDQ
jgi:hypothetical protein